MNIQLLTELQANIHGNELINSILLAPIWFMKYTEVLMIFPILFSSWFLKHNGIIGNNRYPNFCTYFFSYFLSKSFQILDFLQIVNVIFTEQIMNKNYEWLKDSSQIFCIFIHIQYLILLLMH